MCTGPGFWKFISTSLDDHTEAKTASDKEPSTARFQGEMEVEGNDERFLVVASGKGWAPISRGLFQETWGDNSLSPPTSKPQ